MLSIRVRGAMAFDNHRHTMVNPEKVSEVTEKVCRDGGDAIHLLMQK